MNFTVDKENKKINVERKFAAPISKVWPSWTESKLLDQWWAPKPYASKTKVMDFKVGGRRFYAMVTPEGDERWSVQKFTSISPKTNFKYLNAFADENENPQLPGSEWDLTFTEQTGADGHPVTKVSISIFNESLERMERMIEMGFTEGFKSTLQQLDQLLADLSGK